MNILITGGSGLIGTSLTNLLLENGHKVRILTRDNDVKPPFYEWSSEKVDQNAFKDLDGIIHLAGSPINNRWTAKEKKIIFSSRIDTANLLYEYVNKLNIQLKFFISASGASYYGQVTKENIFVEEDEPGNDFLAQVCIKWEKAADQFKPYADRIVKIRTPLVLSKEAKSYQLMKLPTQYGLGACLGTGKQWMPWVHLEDLCRIYLSASENTQFNGPINAVVENQVKHAQFMELLAKSFNKSIWLPNIPAPLVKLTMGENACIILEGSRLSNQKLIDLGFEFNFPKLDMFL